MKVIAEIGSCWQRDKFPLADAIKAALDCGADFVKLQYWTDGRQLATRRGAAKGLEAWNLKAGELLDLADKFSQQAGKPVLGFSVFVPEDLDRLDNAVFSRGPSPFAFVKSATQEYQWAALAQRMSLFSSEHQVPLYVSVPRDGCLVMGNYWSPYPITWLYCEPKYPAEYADYGLHRVLDMAARLPGAMGISDHTKGSAFASHAEVRFCSNRVETGETFVERVEVAILEKHFCYDESLRGNVPDGGPWSLSQHDFKKYVQIAHGEKA